jgi:anti-sigma-K factor RskA
MDKEPIQDEMRRLLARLPDAPVASNFTARVIEAIDLEEARARRGGWNLFWNWRMLVPRAAAALLALTFAGLTVQHYRLDTQRSLMAKNVALVAHTPMPSLDALKDFDAIKSMSHPARADNELLALMQ